MGRALIVSAGTTANDYLSARLRDLGYSPASVTLCPSASEARRRMTETDYELIVVNAPLPDELGHELCMDAAEKTDAGILFLVKAAVADQLLAPMGEHGVLLLSKPFGNALFLQAVQMAASSNHRLRRLRQENQALQTKLALLRTVSRAKCCLIQHEQMTEDEAHRYIEKLAMDTRRSRADVAQTILERYELQED